MEFLRQLLLGTWRGIAQAWRRLSLSARVNIGLAAVATLVAIAALVATGASPQYVPLYENLQPADMADMREILDGQNISFKLQNAGRTMMVPLSDRSKARLALAEQGLPKSHGAVDGFELFDQPSLMATQFQQNVNLQRAVQNSLQRMLTEFDFVDRALVRITQATDELFVAEQQPSEAAVTLTVNRPVSKGEIKGMLGIISSFGGSLLTPEHITLMQTDGKILHRPSQDEFDRIANSQKEYHTEFEREREREAEDALRRMNVQSVVQVALMIDFSTSTERTEKYEKGVPISTMATTRTLTTEESLPEGPAGALVNLPAGSGARGTKTEESEEEIIENLQPSVTTIEKTNGPGDVTDAQVTAIVEGRYTPETDDEGNPTGGRTYAGLTDEEETSYKSLLARAVGFGVTPDQVEVYDQPFELEGLVAAGAAVGMEAAPVAAWLVQYQWIFKGLGLLAGFLVLRSFLLRSLVSPEEEEQEDIVPDMPTPSAEELRRREISDEVERLSKEEPDAVASLLRTWLSQSEE
ncbi:MAG: flagellar M-ring protein FliF [bacterium]|nr:flagellar M-ring protein FliF [bacterium]